MKRGLLKELHLVVLLAAWEVVGARSAWAVQSHGGAEGLVSHQIGHLFFLAGAGVLLWQVTSRHLQGKGWAFFCSFLWLISLWNVLTFTGHGLRESIDSSQFIRDGKHIEFFVSTGVTDILFYLASLDHLILLPALVCLAFALREWTLSP